MKKTDLITKVQSKTGFKSIVNDVIAPDSPKTNENQKIEKRYFEVATANADGTAGITFVFYLYDIVTEDAWFYNTEVEALDINEPTVNQKKVNKIIKYLDDNFDFVEIMGIDEGKERIKAQVNKFGDSNNSAQSIVIAYKDRVTKEFTHVTIA